MGTAPAPTVVGVLFPFGPAPAVSGRLEGVADVRFVGWADDVAVRAAKAHGTRGSRWVRAHEAALSDAQRADLAAAEVLLAMDLPLDVATLAPRLRVVQGVAAGVGQLVEVLRGSGIHLCSAAGLGSDKIAEFVMARLLQVWLSLRRMDELQCARRWAPGEVESESVAGRTVVVVGTGGIGQAVARRACAFELSVVGVRRRPELGAPPGFGRVVGPEGLLEALAQADALVVAAPATERTRQLIGHKELEAMPQGAVVCNVARGTLLDEAALVASLDSGHLGAAILDVMAQEPLSRRSPLWTAPRTYLSPHVANAWRPEYLRRVGELLADNVFRYRQGLPLRNEVDLAEGY